MAANPADQSAKTTPCVLIVDDEAELRSLLEEYFARNGFKVHLAADAAQARQQLDRDNQSCRARPDVVILDVHMPGESGLSLARWLREEHPAIAIIMLTTAGEAVDRIVGLELGADDYLAKPFELRELLARARAVLRRTRAAAPVQAATEATRRVRFGDCMLDLDQHKLLDVTGAEIPITAAEFDLLALFARHPNRPLNRDHIMEQAHNRGWDVFDRSIDLRVMRLRRKIERNPDKPEVLKTVRNVGYMFVSSPL